MHIATTFTSRNREAIMQYQDAPYPNGHAALRMPSHFMPLDVRQHGEFPMGLHRLRVIMVGQGVRLNPPGPHWGERNVPVIIEQDENEAAVEAGLSRRVACRRLYPQPGQEVVVAWADARDLLAGQLAHPERLRDRHQLRCHAQVYEAMASQQREMLATAMLGDPSLAAMLHPLTDGWAARLGLAATLPPRSASPPQRREPGMVLAGDRLIRLLVADDPTRDSLLAQREARDRLPARVFAPQAAAPFQPAPNATPCMKIPQQYLQPWEFRRTREEAIYEMHLAAEPGFWRRLFRALRGPTVSRRELLRWQIIMSGKSVADQLWGVRPPPGGLVHPKVRDWAARTLALAGYDPVLMLAEWEIYWRRKTN
jgi:hypothetical protein